MNKSIERFLEFDGKRISVLLADGEWWVAIKPICEALGVNYDRQQKNIKDDEILSQLYAIQHTTGSDGKLYKMTCLPEKYVYGWLFSIKSDALGLKQYKLMCYDVLYKHFHGCMTDRMNLLAQKETNIRDIEALKVNEALENYTNLINQNKRLDRQLKELDTDLLTGQIKFDLN